MRLPLLPPGKRLLRKIGLAALADYSPYHMGRPFDQTVPRRVYRFHKNWLVDPNERKEAEAAIDAYDGGDFVDVGAARGAYPLFLAPKARNAKFLLLEPDPFLVQALAASLRVAMENNAGFVPYVVPVGAGAETVRGFEFDANRRRFRADILRIDDLVTAFGLSPSFVKIDVDGPELSVLKGMRQTIAQYRPHVLLELHPPFWRNGETEQDVFSQLPNYRFGLIWESEWREFPGVKCSRFLCVPMR
jgi:FkbM family methyltransferase